MFTSVQPFVLIRHLYTRQELLICTKQFFPLRTKHWSSLFDGLSAQSWQQHVWTVANETSRQQEVKDSCGVENGFVIHEEPYNHVLTQRLNLDIWTSLQTCGLYRSAARKSSCWNLQLVKSARGRALRGQTSPDKENVNPKAETGQTLWYPEWNLSVLHIYINPKSIKIRTFCPAI